MSNKIKIFTIGDHPLSPSGVGTQSKYMIEGMLKTGKYEFVSFGGAIGHKDHNPQHTEEWGNDWIIWPVDGYGNVDQVRAMIEQQKPDILWFMTDPRFYEWLWQIENEVRTHIPMVYYHVWDNHPAPHFNKRFYDSNDHIACISQVTYDIVRDVSPDVESSYIPHAVDDSIFTPLPPATIAEFRKAHNLEDKFIVFWNSRNARRKQSGTLIWWFKEFLDKVGHDKAVLVMHTDTKDQHGQDLDAIVNTLGLTKGQVRFSRNKVSPQELNVFYNMADITACISDAEGFGLSTLESMTAGTPILVTLTGGLQDQVTDGENWFGVGIEPASKAIIGSQQVPYIYEDRISKEDFLAAVTKLYDMTPEARHELGQEARKWSQDKFSFEKYVDSWDKLFTKINNEKGSWENRKGYALYEVRTF
jgi:glycosyltransferase involved in cell wall biosynthesis|tara:strand:- start:974 stop:2224 length:1251 start_codon:yes stop_codon:yes gene_type:complete